MIYIILSVVAVLVILFIITIAILKIYKTINTRKNRKRNTSESTRLQGKLNSRYEEWPDEDEDGNPDVVPLNSGNRT